MTGIEERIAEVEWRSVSAALNYEVSNTGRVRSLPKTQRQRDGHVYHYKGRELRLINFKGYRRVSLINDAGKRETFSVHTLVCAAFNGPRPSPKHEVCHLNGVKDDNRPENLRWGTKSENQLDSVRQGVHVQARKTHCPQRHPYSEDNTRWTGNNRHCLICERERLKRSRPPRRPAVLDSDDTQGAT